MHVRQLLLAVTLSLLLVACDGGGTGGGGGGAGTGGGGAEAGGGSITIPSQPEPTAPTLGEILAQENASRLAREQKVLNDAGILGPRLNDFWTRELSSRYQLTFDAPDRYEWYRGEQQTSCGGVTEPRADNAYYCFPEHEEHVAFDLAWFQQYLVNHPGGATTFLILAHEWGHAVQDTWLENGGGDTWNPASRKELNADCLAGVFLAASIRDGTIVEEAGDADAIFGWLYEEGSSPWLARGTHGTRDERQAAFVDGFHQGTAFCRANY
ncbi:MAG: hypothetical protein H0U12_00180 [Thermoleophilaceae bacterium]|nr:hypothetical protein [Thermoleophilaceae bacterium]